MADKQINKQTNENVSRGPPRCCRCARRLNNKMSCWAVLDFARVSGRARPINSSIGRIQSVSGRATCTRKETKARRAAPRLLGAPQLRPGSAGRGLAPTLLRTENILWIRLLMGLHFCGARLASAVVAHGGNRFERERACTLNRAQGRPCCHLPREAAGRECKGDAGQTNRSSPTWLLLIWSWRAASAMPIERLVDARA